MDRANPGPATCLNPRAEYARRLEASQAAFALTDALHRRCGNLKLLTLAAAVVMIWLVLGREAFSPWWLLIPAGAYVILVIYHRRVLRRRARLERVTGFYKRGIARIDDEWAGGGSQGERFKKAKSVYADDLDIFGKGGLFELLSTARSEMGEDKLASWLLAPASPPEIAERQNAITELKTKLDWRERVGVVGDEMRAPLDPAAFRSWSAGRFARFYSPLRIAAAALAIAAVATFIYALATHNYLAVVIVLVVEGLVIHRRYYKPSRLATQGIGATGKALRTIAELARTIEREEFASPRLQALAANFCADGRYASAALRRLATIADWIDARESMFIKIIDLPLLYTIQCGFAAERWRRQAGAEVPRWLDAIGEIEALLSIAAFAYERPDDPFPEFDATSAGPSFEAQGLGHPLIPASRCVRNDVRLGGDQRVLVVSGSNMSGKSTLLRSVGINAVLAMAGAPVVARSLRLTPLALGSRMRTVDSLQEGQSRFYAEILRIRQVLELASGQPPVLFLFDELLEGTNSKDRVTGAEGVVRAMIERGAIGIVTTHDLALAAMAGAAGNSIHNFHFQERIEDGKMTFDYTLRDGVVETSNALDLMRWIGIEV